MYQQRQAVIPWIWFKAIVGKDANTCYFAGRRMPNRTVCCPEHRKKSAGGAL